MRRPQCSLLAFVYGRPRKVPFSDVRVLNGAPLDVTSAFRSEATAVYAGPSDVSEAGAATFEPVLNVPALTSFLVVAVFFGFLALRTSRIEGAVQQRAAALDKLRKAKSAELSGKADESEVEQALEAYREAYWSAEDLRTIIPGVRIVPPPGTLTQDRIRENEAAAQQFLGIQTEKAEEAKSKGSLSTVQIVLLTVVGLSQIALLGLLSLDPMSASDVFTTVDAVGNLS